MSIKKILYIESGVDEKASSRMLEKSTASLPFPVAFTVVSNAFIGLECTEHTFYDTIIIKYDLNELRATDMLRILTNVGATTLMVLLVDRDARDSIDTATTRRFFDVLYKPFSAADLCSCIQIAVDNDVARTHKNITSILMPAANGTRRKQHRAITGQSQSTTAAAHGGHQPDRGAPVDVDEAALSETFDTQSSIALYQNGDSSTMQPSTDFASVLDGNSTNAGSAHSASMHVEGPGLMFSSSGSGVRSSSAGHPTANLMFAVSASGQTSTEASGNSSTHSSHIRGGTEQQSQYHRRQLSHSFSSGVAGCRSPDLANILSSYSAQIHTNESYQRLAQAVLASEGVDQKDPLFGREDEGGGLAQSRGSGFSESKETAVAAVSESGSNKLTDQSVRSILAEIGLGPQETPSIKNHSHMVRSSGTGRIDADATLTRYLQYQQQAAVLLDQQNHLAQKQTSEQERHVTIPVTNQQSPSASSAIQSPQPGPPVLSAPSPAFGFDLLTGASSLFADAELFDSAQNLDFGGGLRGGGSESGSYVSHAHIEETTPSLVSLRNSTDTLALSVTMGTDAAAVTTPPQQREAVLAAAQALVLASGGGGYRKRSARA